MRFVGLLQFAARYCVGVLAWPVIALGYPLCASIKAIETNSVSDTQKLNTYWVTFSLILLFEHAFARLFERLVIWPYIRLMIVCCLVIPYFDGAVYIYNHLIRPCLSVDPQIVINWFNKRKESSYVKDYILTEMERYVIENGPEALEKILASKSGSTRPNLDVQEIESVSSVENKVVEKSGNTKRNLGVQEIESVSSVENKVVEKSGSTKPNRDVQEIESVSSIENKMLEKSGSTKPNLDVQEIESISSVENKVVVKSGSTKPNLDVQEIESVSSIENKMLEKSGSTKPNLDVQEIESVSSVENKVVEKSGSTKPNLDVQEIESVSSIENKMLEKLNSGSPNVTQKDIKSVEVLEKKEVRAAAEQVSSVEPNLTQVENLNFAAPEIKKMVSEVVVAAHRELPKTPAPPDHKVQKWTCEICQVTTTSEKTLKSHYRGKKHKSKTRPKDVPTFIPNNSDRPAMEPRNSATSKGCPGNVEVQGQPQSIHASAARKSEPKEEPAKWVTTSSSGIKQKVIVKPVEKVHKHQPNKPNQGSNFGVKSSSLWCSICNVSCTSEIDMLSHIRGRRHSSLFKLSTGM